MRRGVRGCLNRSTTWIAWILVPSLSLLPPLFGCSGASSTQDEAGIGGSGGSLFGTGNGGGATGGANGIGGGSSVVTGGSGGTLGAGGAIEGSGGGTGGSSEAEAVPSAGCGKAGRPDGGSVSGTVSGMNYLGRFPEGYDGSTPMPVVLGLHACGNPITQIRDLTNNSQVATDFVGLFPKAAGSCWDKATDKTNLDAVIEGFFADYCVDLSRVYLTGHSSGAGMAVQLICDGDERFRAAAPVAAWKVCNSVNPIAMMYIQGIADAARGGSDGKDVVDVFSTSNSCESSSSDYAVSSCSGFMNKPVDPGCIQYDGCSQPTVWCSHNDEGYNLTDGHYHGWPCFASEAMADFFLSLP